MQMFLNIISVNTDLGFLWSTNIREILRALPDAAVQQGCEEMHCFEGERAQ